MHAGESLLVRVAVARDGRPVTGGQVAAQFWAPGKDPEHDLAARAAPDHTAPCRYDEASRRWVARVDGSVTGSWAPGTWTVRGQVPGEEAGWPAVTFPLAA